MSLLPNTIFLRSVKALLFDMDGVVYRGQTPLPGVKEMLAYLHQTGRDYLFVSNFPLTSDGFAKKLAGMGLDVPKEKFLGSALATARYLTTLFPAGSKLLVVGEPGLFTTLTENGFIITSDPDEAVCVVATIDFNLTYDKAARATLAIRKGARFIGTNPDKCLPTEAGLVPGAGAIQALLEQASGVSPEVVGKPQPGMYQEAMRMIGSSPAQTLMVGDRYDSDISGALALGIRTAGVLTGVYTREMFLEAPRQPDLITEGLPELLALFKEADSLQPE